MEFGEIVFGSQRYKITHDDYVWLVRAVECEGGLPEATAWTIIQRFAIFWRFREPFSSFIRKFSQPVNPLWASKDSELCRKYPHLCSDKAIAFRRRCIELDPGRAKVAPMIERLLRAGVPNPVPRAYDFAAPSVAASFLLRHRGHWLLLKHGNWYLGGPLTKELPFDAVTIHYRSAVSRVEPHPRAVLSSGSADSRPSDDVLERVAAGKTPRSGGELPAEKGQKATTQKFVPVGLFLVLGLLSLLGFAFFKASYGSNHPYWR